MLGKDFKVYGDLQEPLFLAKDVAEWIDYPFVSRTKKIRNVSQMVRVVDEDEKIMQKIISSSYNVTTTSRARKTQESWFLTEDGLYEVLMQSRKPVAKDVAEWIEHSNVSKMLNAVDDDEKLKSNLSTLTNGYSAMFLTRDGLFEVLMQSRKPIAKDVAEWIEHSNVSKMLNAVDDDEKLKSNLSTLTNGYSAMFLTRDGLFEVLMQSRKPIAKDVAEWVDYTKTGQGYYDVNGMLRTVDEDEKTTITNSNSCGSKIY